MLDLKYWLWLATRAGLKPAGQNRVLHYFGDPKTAYWADPREYQKLSGLRSESRRALLDKSMDEANRILTDCTRLGVHIYTVHDPKYPSALREILDPPLVLYVRGRQFCIDDCLPIAIAGTRRASDYGARMAYRMGKELVSWGALVLTGVVPGCDYAACMGALDAGGEFACVLAGGVDMPFDERSDALYRRVLERGALISEYPPGYPLQRSNFPLRNRILTGLCEGVVCVEGGRKSGTVLVADYAAEQGRDVFAVMNVGDQADTVGVIQLIKDGAVPVSEWEDVRYFYSGRFPAPQRVAFVRRQPEESELFPWEREPAQSQPEGSAPQGEEQPAVQGEESLSWEEKFAQSQPERSAPQGGVKPDAPETEPQKSVDIPSNSSYIDLQAHCDAYTNDEILLLRCLQSGAQTADEVIEHTQLPASQVLSALTLLTIRGLVQEVPGGRYQTQVQVD